MRTIIQLDPPIWLYTPRGPGLAFFLIRESIDHDLEWVCAQQGTSQCWTWSNQDIRFQENFTLGRDKPELPIHVKKRPLEALNEATAEDLKQ